MGIHASGEQRSQVSPARALAGLVVPTSLAAASALLVWAASAPVAAVRAPGPAPVDALVALGAAVGCAGLLALVALGATLSLIALRGGQVTGRLRRLAVLLTPQVVRVALSLAVGVTVIGGPVGAPAMGLAGGPAIHPHPRSATDSATATLPPGWSPDWPVATSAGASSGHAGRSRPANRVTPVVVVVRGDTLWAIAARHLEAGASAAQVAAEWPRWYAANRSTIGRDPDVLFPGQRLLAPARPHTAAPTADRP